MDVDTELRQQEMERDNLQRIVSAVEAAIAASTPAGRGALERSLQNAKAHLAVIEKKIKDTKGEIEHQKQERQSLAEMQAAREIKLNADEQRNFAGFLKEDFFTKKDFNQLDEFYRRTWDRLSQSGKNSMSHRIWEGIRHGEYRFDELPPAVREKEMERAYQVLGKRAVAAPEAEAIPERDRNDFIKAYESGHRDEAAKVLNRDIFKKSMFRSDESKPVKSVQAFREPERGSIGARIAANSGSNEQKGKPSEDDLNLGGVQLDGLKVADVKNPPSAKDIPRNGSAPSKGDGLLRGG